MHIDPAAPKEEEKKDEYKRPEKFNVAIVDVSDSIETQARDVAEARMARDKGELTGVSGWFKKVFKHNLGREVYRQTEINKARKEIMDTDNLYAGEGADKQVYMDAKEAVVGRFMEDYKEAVHEDAGEKKGKLGQENSEDVATKKEIETLIKSFASGKIDQAVFLQEKDQILESVRQSKAEYFDSGKKYADNLLQVAEHIKANIAHYEGLEKLDLNLDVVIGRARTGARTEAQFNAVDRLVEKFSQRTGGKGTALINEATVGLAGGIAMSILNKTVPAFAKSKLLQWMTFGATTAIAAGTAAYKEGYRLSDERKQHAREMAKGDVSEPGAKRREEMENYRYLTKSSEYILKSLSFEKEKGDVAKDKIQTSLLGLIDLEARIKLSDSRKIDLIGYSDSTKIEKERWDLDIARAKAKVELRKLAVEGKVDTKGLDFDKHLESLVQTQINGLRFGGEGIDQKDQAFKKMRSRKMWKAAGRVRSLVAPRLLSRKKLWHFSGQAKMVLWSRWLAEEVKVKQIRHYSRSSRGCMATILLWRRIRLQLVKVSMSIFLKAWISSTTTMVHLTLPGTFNLLMQHFH
ncbi:MAG: hypothetical protein RL641_457 [Candidatus Parcubacteria bacterium]|jgi:hypothetical protein